MKIIIGVLIGLLVVIIGVGAYFLTRGKTYDIKVTAPPGYEVADQEFLEELKDTMEASSADIEVDELDRGQILAEPGSLRPITRYRGPVRVNDFVKRTPEPDMMYHLVADMQFVPARVTAVNPRKDDKNTYELTLVLEKPLVSIPGRSVSVLNLDEPKLRVVGQFKFPNSE